MRKPGATAPGSGKPPEEGAAGGRRVARHTSGFLQPELPVATPVADKLRRTQAEPTVERPAPPHPADAAGAPGAPGVTTPQFPCLCPGEKYPITRAVCLGRQERNYERCLTCQHSGKHGRVRKTDHKER